MKIKRLQLLDQSIFVGDGAKVNSESHVIAREGAGWLVRYKRSGAVYFIPLQLAVAEVDMSEEDNDAGPPAAGAGPAARRARQPKGTPPLPG